MPVGELVEVKVATKTSRLPTLDGLRGIAIIAVLAIHLEAYAFPWEHLLPAAFLAISRTLYIGVDLFFVLSGFLITDILVRSRGGIHAMRNFYMRRVLRVFPLYYSAIFIVFVVMPKVLPRWMTWQMDWGQITPWTYLIFLSNLLDSKRGFPSGGYLSIAWSLAIEEQFYLIWPWIVRSISLRGVRGVCMAIMAFSPLARTAGWLWGINLEAVYVFTPLRLDGLAAGAWLAVTVIEYPKQSRLAKPIFLTMSSLYVALVIFSAIFPARGTEHVGESFFRFQPALYTVGCSVIAIAFAALLYMAIHATGRLQAILSNKWLATVGLYSFSIYLLHYVIGRQISSLFQHFAFFGIGIGYVSLILYLAVTGMSIWVTAWLTRRFIEVPFLRLKRYFPG